MRHEDYHIILFLNNAPYPSSLMDHFSNIKMAFLPKKTSCTLLMLELSSSKKLKQRDCYSATSVARSKDRNREIAKSFNLLMAILWGNQAWDDSQDTIAKCFNRMGLVPDANSIDGNDNDDDPFKEYMLNLEELCGTKLC